MCIRDRSVLVTSHINDILVKYCKMKNMDPNEYALKVLGKNYILDLNDTVSVSYTHLDVYKRQGLVNLDIYQTGVRS